MNLFITGASGGLGQSIVKRAISLGHKVYATDLREYFSKEGNPSQKSMFYYGKHNVIEESDWIFHLNKFESIFGYIDILINVAGYLKPGYVHEFELSEIQKHFDVNVNGVILGTRLVSEKMVKRQSGHIINIASLAGVAPISGLALYSSSKFAVRAFSLAASDDLHPFNVSVSVVCPDAIKTPMLDLQKDYKEAAMTFSGSRPLTTEEVTDLIFNKVIFQKRKEYILPASRGILAKLGNFFPDLSSILLPILRKKGLEAQQKEV